MDKQSLTYKTFKNISYGIISYGWMLVFSIFITPLIVLKLGAETYGVYILVLTIGSLLGMFDLGVGQILIKYIAEYSAAGEMKKLKDLMYSFNLILLGLSILGLVAFAVIGKWAYVLFPSLSISGQDYFIIFLLSGLVSFVNGLNSLFAMVPVAMQRFDTSTKLGLASMTLSNLTILFFVILGYGLKAIFLSQLFYSVIFFFLFRLNSKKILPEADLKFAWEWPEVKKAYKFGIATYMSNVANQALTYFDRLLIPVFFGPAALSYYAMPGNVAGKIPAVTNTLSGIVFPMISGLHGVQDMEKIKTIYKRAFNLLTVIGFAVTISIVLFANKILLYWLNAEFASKSTGVLIILAFTYYFLALGGTLNSFLLGLSKTKFLFQSSLFMAIANVGFLFLLLPRFGIMGAAWAYLISVLPVIFMFYYSEKIFFSLSGRLSYYLKLYAKLSAVAVIFSVMCIFVFLPLVSSLKSLIILGPLSVLFFLFIYRILGFFDREDMTAIDSFIIIMLGKLKFTR